ncbi:hypothetical protein [Halorussus sp. AFM4]|uniref:hypothetical protein n=1 Tax=Halorussus sp. AFM4 TaxID=3421651 RepID=UPI003EBE4399
MTPQNELQHRAYHQPDPDRVTVREPDDEDTDGVFTVRMPIASTGEVRNQGDDPLTRDELAGMAQQIEERSVGVFLDHGANRDISASRYGATGKVGEWANPDVVDAGEEDLLEADARLMDPDTLPDATGSVREALSALKAQVERDFALSSSIGWREDDTYPGGNDLMEASIVGIGADPRTTSEAPGAATARAVVMGPDGDHRHLSGQQAEIAQQMLASYRDEQGNGSVSNFEDWLWSVAYYEFDDNQFHAARTALQEFYRDTTPLEEPVSEQFAPFLDGQQDASGDGDGDSGDGAEQNQNDMSDTDTEQSGDEPDNENDGSDGISADEFRSTMLEMQEQQTETLRTLADSLRADDEDDEDNEGDDDDDDDDEPGEDDDDDGEQSSDDPDTTQTVVIDGEERALEDVVDEQREQLAALREGGVSLHDLDLDTVDDASSDGADGEREAKTEESEQTTSDPRDLL